MEKLNPFLCTDGYKVSHHKMYPKGTTLVYSNFTPRSNKYAPKGSKYGEDQGELKTIFINGEFKNKLTLTEIRKRTNENIKQI